jgi:hypothetical protein
MEMKTELRKKLVKRFKFLRNKKVDNRTPYYMFGVECGDGWFKLLWKLCEDIEKNLRKGEEFEVTQIKEKFAGLRFYHMGGNDKISELIDNAEEKSMFICEDCGKKGKIKKHMGWLQTLCGKCYKEWVD